MLETSVQAYPFRVADSGRLVYVRRERIIRPRKPVKSRDNDRLRRSPAISCARDERLRGFSNDARQGTRFLNYSRLLRKLPDSGLPVTGFSCVHGN